MNESKKEYTLGNPDMGSYHLDKLILECPNFSELYFPGNETKIMCPGTRPETRQAFLTHLLLYIHFIATHLKWMNKCGPTMKEWIKIRLMQIKSLSIFENVKPTFSSRLWLEKDQNYVSFLGFLGVYFLVSSRGAFVSARPGKFSSLGLSTVYGYKTWIDKTD